MPSWIRNPAPVSQALQGCTAALNSTLGPVLLASAAPGLLHVHLPSASTSPLPPHVFALDISEQVGPGEANAAYHACQSLSRGGTFQHGMTTAMTLMLIVGQMG